MLDMKIVKVISGAQTGADRAGIDAAIACGIPYGGKIPAGRRAEDGPIADHYEELEVLPQRNYLVRTEANVEDSDVTLVFTRGEPRSGSKRTIEFARNHDKLYVHIDLSFTGMSFTGIAKLLIHYFDRLPGDNLIVNVAGSRESTISGIYDVVFHAMVEVLSHFKIQDSPRSK
jgi:hypothetical protein